ncbi:MAG: nitrate reductase, partial [Deltaproteobacteria bacterium]
ARLGIKTGDRVRVASRVGSGRIPVKITEGIREDTVYMESGFGPLSKGLRNIYGVGLCIAEILEDYNDEITGNMAMHETMVTVRKG